MVGYPFARIFKRSPLAVVLVTTFNTLTSIFGLYFRLLISAILELKVGLVNNTPKAVENFAAFNPQRLSWNLVLDGRILEMKTAGCCLENACARLLSGKMSRCDLFLENYVNGYQSGQQIVGHIKCTFTSEKNIKGIVLQFRGVAKTHWTETDSHYNHTTKKNEMSTVRYSGEQSLLHHEIDILPHDDDQIIPNGVHTYPFSYIIPHNLPSSFSGHHGEIIYNVKAIVRRPLLKVNYEAESTIKIIGIINLNDNHILKNPVTHRKTKNVGCCCWRSGPLSFEWTVPYTGFIPGQNIPINIEIENLSNSNIEKVQCRIVQVLKFTCNFPSHRTKTITDEIAEVTLGGVGAHGERTYHDIFPVPGTINPPSFQGCSIIAVQHRLEVEAFLPCCSSNISKSIPIVLGHIAMHEANLGNQNMEPLPSYNELQFPSAPNMASGQGMPSVPYMPSATNVVSASNMANTPFYDPTYAPPQLAKPSFGWQMPTSSAPGAEAPPPNYEDAVLLENPYRKHKY